MTSVLPQTQSMMQVLDKSGHAEIKWDKNVPAEVAMAEQAFEALKAKKYLFYRTRADGSKAEQIKSFDKAAERIVAQPQIVGG